MRIRAGEQWTLRTLEGELNAYGAELYLQGSPPSTFFFIFFPIFIINYSPLIARIIKRGSGKGRRGVPGASAPCVLPAGACVSKYVRKEGTKGRKQEVERLGQQGCRPPPCSGGCVLVRAACFH